MDAYDHRAPSAYVPISSHHKLFFKLRSAGLRLEFQFASIIHIPPSTQLIGPAAQLSPA